MFQSARLQLTIWYVIVVMVISSIFSIAFYQVASREIDRIMRRAEFERQLENDDLLIPRNIPNLQELEEANRNLRLTLIFVNAFILVMSGGIAYFLAGRTLQPIQTMVDEQNRFITDASHELRTPLTALRTEMEASLLDKNISAKKTKQLIKSNLEEVLNLQILSDNLLELVQYERYIKQMKTASISLLQIVEDALKTVASLAKQKKITIANQVSDVIFTGNQMALTQLLVILLDNAIKYSNPRKHITIASRTNSNVLQLSVADEGIGIAEEDIPYIFDRFYRVDKSRTKNTASGYGLGLSIAKNIVQKHQGTIKVKSNLGKGTTFYIKLPARH